MKHLSLFLFCWVAGISLVTAFGPERLDQGQSERGLASWYAEGQTTASGERFNPHELTAAHRTLPFGSVIRVTNLNNGRTVDVRINDRGPYTDNRILDVSSAAADVLQMKGQGVVPVKLVVLRLGSPGRSNN